MGQFIDTLSTVAAAASELISPSSALQEMPKLPEKPPIVINASDDESLLVNTKLPVTQEREQRTNIDSTKIDGVAWAIEATSDGKYVVSGDTGKHLNIWKVTDSKKPFDGERKVIKLDSEIWDVEISPNNKMIAVATADGTIQLVDLEKAKLGPSFKLNQTTKSLSFSKNGNLLAVGMEDGLRVLDSKTGDSVIRRDDAKYYNVAFGPKDSVFATKVKANTPWEIVEFSVDKNDIGGQEGIVIPVGKSQIYCMEVNSKGIIAAGNRDGNLFLYDTKTQAIEIREIVNNSPVWSLDFKGSSLAVGAGKASLAVFDLSDFSNPQMEIVNQILHPKFSVRSVNLYNDNLLFGVDDRSVKSIKLKE